MYNPYNNKSYNAQSNWPHLSLVQKWNYKERETDRMRLYVEELMLESGTRRHKKEKKEKKENAGMYLTNHEENYLNRQVRI